MTYRAPTLVTLLRAAFVIVFVGVVVVAASPPKQTVLTEAFSTVMQPYSWERNYKYDKEWDILLNEIIDNDYITSREGLTVTAGNIDIWVANYPYAYGYVYRYPYRDYGGLGVKTLRADRRIPSRATVRKLKAYVDEHFPERVTTPSVKPWADFVPEKEEN